MALTEFQKWRRSRIKSTVQNDKVSHNPDSEDSMNVVNNVDDKHGISVDCHMFPRIVSIVKCLRSQATTPNLRSDNLKVVKS